MIYIMEKSKSVKINADVLFFIKDYCERGHDKNLKPLFIKQSELYRSFVMFCQKTTHTVYSQNYLTKEVKRIGFLVRQKWFKDEDGKRYRSWCYIGLSLKNQDSSL